MMKHAEFVERLQQGAKLGYEDESMYRYHDLKRILNLAYDFAAKGKGEERHGKAGLPWTQQRHVTIGRECGSGFAIGQAVKKAFESRGLPTKERKIAELIGAITYLASAIYAVEQRFD